VQPDHAEHRVGLVHRSVGRNPEIGLGHALARPEGRVTGISGSGIDLVQNDQGFC
jgi:hypothetical protein